MNTQITLEEGRLELTEQVHGRHLRVLPNNPDTFIHKTTCITHYPNTLIEKIAHVKGLAYVCDEIERDEDPFYIDSHLKETLFSFITPEQYKGKRLLDFGCGSGASTMLLAKHLPHTTIIGIELEAEHLEIAKLRAEHYGYQHIQFLQSPSGDTLPADIGEFDMIILPAVYEHLLPSERTPLTKQLWSILKPGGFLLIDETPHRWFPAETHTASLPLINYLPSFIALPIIRYLSPRKLRRVTWEELLRMGVRGSTTHEITKRIRDIGGQYELPQPLLPTRTPVDIWFDGYAKHAQGKKGVVKRLLKHVLNAFYFVTRIPLVPYITVVIKKI